MILQCLSVAAVAIKLNSLGFYCQSFFCDFLVRVNWQGDDLLIGLLACYLLVYLLAYLFMCLITCVLT